MKMVLPVVASLFVMFANSAGATITVVNPPARLPVSGTSNWDWLYAAVLQTQDMKPGDFFTIFDFPLAGFLSTPVFGTTSADDNALFAVSVQNTGATPPKTAPTDNPAVTNVTVTLLDGDVTQPGTQDLSPLPGGLQLGTLSIRSATKLVAQSQFGSALDHASQTPTSQLGPVEVPAIPEPASIAMMLAGLVACGAFSFRRRIGS
jgi:hypothetical protein